MQLSERNACPFCEMKQSKSVLFVFHFCVSLLKEFQNADNPQEQAIVLCKYFFKETILGPQLEQQNLAVILWKLLQRNLQMKVYF